MFFQFSVNIMENFVKKWVTTFFQVHDYNCVRATFLRLPNILKLNCISRSWMHSVGMHGAGGYRAQCGLVEGTLLFLGGAGLKKMLRNCFLHCSAGYCALAGLTRMTRLIFVSIWLAGVHSFPLILWKKDCSSGWNAVDQDFF